MDSVNDTIDQCGFPRAIFTYNSDDVASIYGNIMTDMQYRIALDRDIKVTERKNFFRHHIPSLMNLKNEAFKLKTRLRLDCIDKPETLCYNCDYSSSSAIAAQEQQQLQEQEQLQEHSPLA
jgi:hypothetical protein